MRIGIIGCGKVAHLHAKALMNLSLTDLVAVWSRSKSSADTFAEKYNVHSNEDITEMIQTHRLEMVIICTPHPYHLQPAVSALKAGAHVLIEKPMASSLEDCDIMLKTAKETNKKIGVISQRRWYLPVQRIKKTIDANKIGKPVLGIINMFGWRDRAYYESDDWRGTWQHEGGGVLINQAPHLLDILLWFMGEISEVVAFWDNLNHPYIEVDDTALAIIKFKNGALGNIVVSNSQKPGLYGKVHVHGENGSTVGVQTDGGAMFVAGMTEIVDAPYNDLWTIPEDSHKIDGWVAEDKSFFNSINPTVYYMEKQIEDFVLSIKNNLEPLVNGHDGRRTVELITAIYRSQRDKKIVKFPLEPEINSTNFDGRIM